MSSIRAGDGLVEERAARSFMRIEHVVVHGVVVPILHPAAQGGRPGSIVTRSTPASTSRRASRHCCPQALRP